MEYEIARRFVMATLTRHLAERGKDLHEAMIAELEDWQQKDKLEGDDKND